MVLTDKQLTADDSLHIVMLPDSDSDVVYVAPQRFLSYQANMHTKEVRTLLIKWTSFISVLSVSAARRCDRNGRMLCTLLCCICCEPSGPVTCLVSAVFIVDRDVVWTSLTLAWDIIKQAVRPVTRYLRYSDPRLTFHSRLEPTRPGMELDECCLERRFPITISSCCTSLMRDSVFF